MYYKIWCQFQFKYPNLHPGLQHYVSTKSGNYAKCVRITAGHRPAQANWVEALFPFLSKPAQHFCKTKSKVLNSRVLAGGFVMGCAKKSWF